jgi:hypothetical protein
MDLIEVIRPAALAIRATRNPGVNGPSYSKRKTNMSDILIGIVGTEVASPKLLITSR